MVGKPRPARRGKRGTASSTMPSKRPQPGVRVETGGGAYIGGNVTNRDGTFVGRDYLTTTEPASQATLQEFTAILENLRMALSEMQLEEKIHAEVERELARIQEESEDPKPSLSIIEAKFASIQGLIQKAAGVVLATGGFAQAIQQAVAIAQGLFR